jgi:hypothetical protein
MKLLVAISVVSAVLMAPASASAAAFDFSDCTVIEIVAAGDQNAHVQLSCYVTNAPACATSANFVSFDKSTTAGKEYLSLFMMAQAMGGKVTGYVDHASCPPWLGNVPYLNHLRVTR